MQMGTVVEGRLSRIPSGPRLTDSMASWLAGWYDAKILKWGMSNGIGREL